jgi:hypothetical protein
VAKLGTTIPIGHEQANVKDQRLVRCIAWFSKTKETDMSDLIPPMMPDDLDALIQSMERVQQLEAEVARLRLTDEERVDVAMWLSECLRQCSLAADGGSEEVAERWRHRSERAAQMLERLR